MQLVIIREFTRRMAFEEVVEFLMMDNDDLEKFMLLTEQEYKRFVDDHVRVGVAEAEQMKLMARGDYTKEEWQATLDDMYTDDIPPTFSNSFADVRRAKRFLRDLRYREEFPFYNPEHTPPHIFNDFDSNPTYQLWQDVIVGLGGYIGTQNSIMDLAFKPSDFAVYYETQLEYIKDLYPRLYNDEDENGQMRQGVRKQPKPYYMDMNAKMVEPTRPGPSFGSLAAKPILQANFSSLVKRQSEAPEPYRTQATYTTKTQASRSSANTQKPRRGHSAPTRLQAPLESPDRVQAPPKSASQKLNSEARKNKKEIMRSVQYRKANLQRSSLRQVTNASDLSHISAEDNAKAGIFTEALLIRPLGQSGRLDMQNSTFKDVAAAYENSASAAPPIDITPGSTRSMGPPPVPSQNMKREAQDTAFAPSKKTNTHPSAPSQLTNTTNDPGSFIIAPGSTGSVEASPVASQTKKKKMPAPVKKANVPLGFSNQFPSAITNSSLAIKSKVPSRMTGSVSAPSVSSKGPDKPPSYFNQITNTSNGCHATAAAASSTLQKSPGTKASKPTPLTKGGVPSGYDSLNQVTNTSSGFDPYASAATAPQQNASYFMPPQPSSMQPTMQSRPSHEGDNSSSPYTSAASSTPRNNTGSMTRYVPTMQQQSMQSNQVSNANDSLAAATGTPRMPSGSVTSPASSMMHSKSFNQAGQTTNPSRKMTGTVARTTSTKQPNPGPQSRHITATGKAINPNAAAAVPSSSAVSTESGKMAPPAVPSPSKKRKATDPPSVQPESKKKRKAGRPEVVGF
jgi:hypothetical protein